MGTSFDQQKYTLNSASKAYSVKTTKHAGVGTWRATLRTTVFQSKLRGKFKMLWESLYF